jgi:phosphoglycerol transferase MdoB-like AlkP superfamily enzyme
VLVLLSFSRICLYFFNLNYFDNLSQSELFSLFIKGLRFDIAALLMLNFALIFLSTFPFSFHKKDSIGSLVVYFSLLLNGIAITANLIDAIYFRFTLKRSTYDILDFLEANVGLYDIFKALFLDFWAVLLLSFFLNLLLFLVFMRTERRFETPKLKPKQLLYKSFLFLIILGFSIIGLRGGFQLKPLNLVDAGKLASSKQVPLILNTPFSLIVTRGQDHLTQKEYFSKKEALFYYNPVKHDKSEASDRDLKNVVVLILESFSANRIGYFSTDSAKISLTPFIDSLLKKSLTFKGIANGKRSIEGIPAILSGIPTLMRQPFLTSIYANNHLSGLPRILKKQAYTTAFFHGGKNGTMNLDSYAEKVGFDSYFGMTEYANDKDYDGSWGIWDHAFYPFFKNKLDHFAQPFLATFFSLSSHHPYHIPKEYESKFEANNPLDESLAYADFALSQFFNSAKDEKWFQNTLFIITADHSAELLGTADSSNLIHFEIPIAFYSVQDTLLIKRPHRATIQQSDIFPSILDYLNFPDTIIAFGNSVFDTLAPDFALYFLNETYHGIYSESTFDFDGNEFSFSNKGKISIQRKESIEKQTKALIQNYADFMIHNKLVPSSNEKEN